MPPPSKRFTLQSYDLGSFDSNYCLKPPLTLWLVMLYLARAILIPFLGGVSSMGGAGDASSVTRGFFGAEDFVSAALALIVLLAYFRRTPSASRFWRRLWSFGRIMLAAAAVFDLGVSLYRFLQITDTDMLRSELLLLACTLDAYIVVYLFRSRRVRDVFRDFPAPL
jgi:hypothetical protein